MPAALVVRTAPEESYTTRKSSNFVLSLAAPRCSTVLSCCQQEQSRMPEMIIRTADPWPSTLDDLRPVFGTRDRLSVAGAIIDGLCLSALLWMAIALLVR